MRASLLLTIYALLLALSGVWAPHDARCIPPAAAWSR